MKRRAVALNVDEIKTLLYALDHYQNKTALEVEQFIHRDKAVDFLTAYYDGMREMKQLAERLKKRLPVEPKRRGRRG